MGQVLKFREVRQGGTGKHRLKEAELSRGGVVRVGHGRSGGSMAH